MQISYKQTNKQTKEDFDRTGTRQASKSIKADFFSFREPHKRCKSATYLSRFSSFPSGLLSPERKTVSGAGLGVVGDFQVIPGLLMVPSWLWSLGQDPPFPGLSFGSRTEALCMPGGQSSIGAVLQIQFPQAPMSSWA